jgi:ABC-type lipoprotein release transport system permease subunit
MKIVDRIYDKLFRKFLRKKKRKNKRRTITSMHEIIGNQIITYINARMEPVWNNIGTEYYAMSYTIESERLNKYILKVLSSLRRTEKDKVVKVITDFIKFQIDYDMKYQYFHKKGWFMIFM